MATSFSFKSTYNKTWRRIVNSFLFNSILSQILLNQTYFAIQI